MDEKENILLELLRKPKSYAIDGESVTMQSVTDALAALEAARKARPCANPWGLLARAKIQTGEAGR